MRMTILATAALGLPILLSGCFTPGSYLSEIADKGADVGDGVLQKFAEGVDHYCLQVPGPVRVELRTRINDKTTRGDITIDCAPVAAAPAAE